MIYCNENVLILKYKYMILENLQDVYDWVATIRLYQGEFKMLTVSKSINHA